MKLNSFQIEVVERRCELEAIGESDVSQPWLEKMFGKHTFFVSEAGLFVFVEQVGFGEMDQTAQLFAVAMWSEINDDELVPVEPAAEIDIILDLKHSMITGRQ